MQKKTKADVVRRIQQVGYLREIDTSELGDPSLQVDHNPMYSTIFDWGGGSGLILELRITARRRIRVMEFSEIVVAGRDLNVDWCPQEESSVYRFYGSSGPEFPAHSVLNHRVANQGLVRPGDPLEGFLLGRSYTPLPFSLRRDFSLPATLSIVDGSGEVHLSELSLRFDATMRVQIQPRRSSLYQTAEERMRGGKMLPAPAALDLNVQSDAGMQDLSAARED